MSASCPNCATEFAEHRDTASRCEHCGWLTQVDGKWHPCPEPRKPADPKPTEPIRVPVPHEPVPAEPAEPLSDPVLKPDRLNSNVRSYLGGLVTVTIEVDDEETID